MAKILKLINHDEQFNNMPFKPIILNDVPAKTEEERKRLNDLIITTYNNTDTLESVPVCSPNCGHLSHGYNLGRVCEICGNRVERSTDRAIESNVWFRTPKGMVSLISPIFWMIMSKKLTASGFNVLEWFCDPYKEDPPATNVRANDLIKKFIKANIPRGYNNLINHFDALMVPLSESGKTLAERAELMAFLTANRNCFFPQHLPMPSKIAFVIENTPTGSFADIAMRDAIDAARTVTSIDEATEANIRKMESKTTSIISALANYYFYMFGKKQFSSKEGWLRRSVLGSRMPFSYRTVIVSGGTTEVTDYETIKIPYAQAVTVFKIHLMNKLNKRGFTLKEAGDFLDTHTLERNPLIESMLDEIFNDTLEGGGVPTIFIRYPSLARGSAQCLRINGVTDFASTLSTMVTKAPNADLRH